MNHSLIDENRKNKISLLAFYNQSNKTFKYHENLLDYFGNDLNNYTLWEYLLVKKYISYKDALEIKAVCEDITDQIGLFTQSYLLTNCGLHCFTFIASNNNVTIVLRNLEEKSTLLGVPEYDDLTNLLNRNSFCKIVKKVIKDNKDKKYAMCYFDILHFKTINLKYSYAEGNKFLFYIANVLQSYSDLIPCACRDSADKFAFLADITNVDLEKIVNQISDKIKEYQVPINAICNFGVYIINNTDEDINSILDKACIAQLQIKNNYDNAINYYSKEIQDMLLSEQEITSTMHKALENHEFILHYQPQYSRSTGMIIGAEALVRWKHPEKGLIPPNLFIPLFEKNGFITKLDLYVFEEACSFLSKIQDKNYTILPISINFSKNDIYSSTFVEDLEEIRKKYNIPSKLLHIEITENLLYINLDITKGIIDKLHKCGYLVEMDDFGTGYSSLNILKDLEFDIIKLDMLFLKNNEKNNGRGGTILYSIVNMAKWLNMNIIAEGVETVEQADFLKSIGCDYIQGYLYSKPLTEDKFVELISSSAIGGIVKNNDMIDKLGFANFWNPTSQETLMFNNFVGGAAVICYHQNLHSYELLRVNEKYTQELGMNLSEFDLIKNKESLFLTDNDFETYINTLERAIESGNEEESEVWYKIVSSCCGEEVLCIRSNIKLIGRMGTQFLFYEMIRNITNETKAYHKLLEDEKKFKMAAEQVNVYFWEYTVATKEMRPCFRCMRDLGLPALLKNYPDSAIERGIFPPEVADMYRDWHVQVANGVKELEAIIPLTPDRVPFRVKYTTEFDKFGNPVKAYGSARLIVNEDE